MARPISEIDLSEKLYYEETINGVAATVEYWPIRKDADGVVLLRGKALDQTRQMNKTSVATYIDSVMDTWLNNATDGYLSYFDAKMRACIIPTEIPVKPYGSDTVTTIARQAWLLSESEVAAGGAEGDSILPVLKTHSGETRDNAARIAYNSAGGAVYSWLRSAGPAGQFRCVNSLGDVSSVNAANSGSCPRPAFKVSKDTMASDQGEDVIYILPDASKPYRELSFVAYCGASAQRPKKAKVQVTITNALESTIQISNNAKDAEPAWVTCSGDEVVELPNTAKTTDNWELGVKIYAKSGGRAACSEPAVIVEVDGE